ncbi:MAG TPA: SigE family RNA polymerase sigma factor [Actinomycetales bacterium]|nr:SigE family RNA polymerase sigma factor [Actinomycetales bacterium]
MGRDYDEEFTAWASARAAQLRRSAFLMCGDWHLADDLAQTTLVKIYAAWTRLRRRDALDAYAQRTLVRALLDDVRRPWRREQHTNDWPEVTSAAMHDHAQATVESLVALDLLATLPPRQRAAIVLRFWHDLSVEQVADILGVSVGTVKSQTHKAMGNLRAALQAPVEPPAQAPVALPTQTSAGLPAQTPAAPPVRTAIREEVSR